MKIPRLFLSAVSVVLLAALPAAGREPVRREVACQTPEGQDVAIFTLTNSRGLRARVISWGATLVEMSAPDRAGKMADVTLGFDKIERYLEPHPFFGSIAGRYANRIAKGKFTLDGREYTLATNNGANHLHGGRRGFDKRNWSPELLADGAVRFRYRSPDGEEGYPGTLDVSVTYTLTDQDELRLDYEAVTDQPTVLNLTNHAYWNLAGAGRVISHELRIHATRYTAVDADLIPTGELLPVAGTPLDFTGKKPIGRDMEVTGGNGPAGYDHNFVIDAAKPGELTLAAEVRDPESGRQMRVFTTEPGVQLYTGNHLQNVAGRNGATYGPHAALCLETQHFPDSPNHPEFPSTTLRPGETFRSTTIYQFGVAATP